MKNKVKLTESIQSKSVEPACAEFPSNVVRNSAKQKAIYISLYILCRFVLLELYRSYDRYLKFQEVVEQTPL